MAIGGAIGAGYFLGSGIAIKTAGPSLLLAYAIGGVTMFFIIRALGELTVSHPESGSLGSYATQFIGPLTGFVTGWSYWLAALLGCTAESTGIGILVHQRFPAAPQWLVALCVVCLLYLINICGVRVFGESEYWLAIIKVVTVAAVICYGLAVLIFRVGPLAPHAHLANLWRYGGFMPNGFDGLMTALPIVIFAFGGLEVIGLAAAETEQPEVTVPRAINSVLYRILLFYIGSFAVIMALLPWTQFSAHASPFVDVLSRADLSAAPEAVSLVTIIAIFSSGNTILFASTRMLYGLATAGQAPRSIGKLNRGHAPYRAVTLSAFVLLIGVGLSYMVPDKAFNYLLSMASWLLLWGWASIVISHLVYRRTLRGDRTNQRSFEMPGTPITNWIVLLLISAVGVLLVLKSEARFTFVILAAWLALLVAAYYLRRFLPPGVAAPVSQDEEYEMHS